MRLINKAQITLKKKQKHNSRCNLREYQTNRKQQISVAIQNSEKKDLDCHKNAQSKVHDVVG